MNVYDLLKGKKVKIMTDMKVEVELEIDNIKRQSHERVITPDTKENDWYGESVTTYSYDVNFTNGSTKNYKNLESIEIL